MKWCSEKSSWKWMHSIVANKTNGFRFRCHFHFILIQLYIWLCREKKRQRNVECKKIVSECVLIGFAVFGIAQWIDEWVTAWRSCPCSSFILLAQHVADVIMCSGRIDADRSVGVGLGNGHRTGATDLTLIILGATPEHSLLTLTIANVTIVIQHQYRIASRRCLVRYIHTSHGYWHERKREREKRNVLEWHFRSFLLTSIDNSK